MSLINVTKLSHFTGHTDAVYALCKGSAETDFYSGAGDGYIVNWDYRQGTDGKLMVRVNRPVYSQHVDELGGLLYCGAASGNLHLIDLKAGAEIRNIEAHALGVFDLQALGDKLLSCGGDGKLKVWDRKKLDVLFLVEASEKSARCMSINPSGTMVAVGFSDHKIRIYSSADFKLLDTLDAHANSVFSITFVNDTEFMSGGRDALLKRWNLFESAPMVEIPAHTLHINRIALSPGKQLFATVSMDKTIKIWHTESMQLLKVVDFVRNEGHRSSVNNCLWLDEKTLLSCSDDRAIMMWNIDYAPGP